uniref:Uncharacterized protein n=1 Tax=Panagrolaimus sp. PS1159 TaxID=55785 RepID=A0AC35GLI5_9BILA
MANIPICHRLEINEFNSIVSFEQSLFISVKDIQIGNAEKLFLTNSLVIISKNRNLLTEFIPKIYKCNVRFLKICLQNLSIKDFDFLVENVEKFVSFDSTIRRKNEILSITEIIDRMPKLSHMTFTSNGRVKLFNAAKTVKQMNKEKEAKLDYLYIRTVPAVADPLQICSFIWKNAASNSRFYFELKAPREYVENLDDLIKMEFKKWVPENEKPCVIITKEIILGRI